MHAWFSAIVSAALLLLLLGLVVLARRLGQRLGRRRRSARAALVARAPAASALPAARASPVIAAEGHPKDPAPLPEAQALRPAANGELSGSRAAAPSPSAASPTAAPPAGAQRNIALPPAVASLARASGRGMVWIPSRKRGRTRHAIVLAHGFGGFDTIYIRGRRLTYFRGVSEHLQACGAEVYVLRVSPVASIAVRARQLAEQIKYLPAERVNIVAHSMGGLDARYALAALGVAPKIASLTTISTPHRGTPLADLSVSLLGRGALARLGLSLDAWKDLTTERMAIFNRKVENVPGVEYGCFVATARRGVSGVNALLVPAYLFLHQRAGENDGVVPAESQRWGRVWGEIDVDHWGAVGWSTGFDAALFYEDLVRNLCARGL
jgi:triacylglycerol lipase